MPSRRLVWRCQPLTARGLPRQPSLHVLEGEISFQITLKGSRVRLQLHHAPDVCPECAEKYTRSSRRAEAELKQLQTVIELCRFNEPDQRSQGECACVLGKFIARAETKFEKGASDKKSPTVQQN